MNINVLKKTYMQLHLNIIKLLLLPLFLIGIINAVPAQEIQRPQPRFWLGVSGAANFNFYTGTTQRLNSSVTAPTAFHEGFGIGGYGSALLEYRPHPVWGFMLNVGYDGRGGKFNEVMAPCNCPETLGARLGYLTIEPSLRIAPFSSGFYLFLGGAYNYNVRNSFTYTQKLKLDTDGTFTNIRQNVFSGQVGMGYEIPVSPITNTTQVVLSPFISYHPYFGQEPRSIESWSLSTLRVGIAIKFGKAPVRTIAIVPPVVEGGTTFSMVAPLTIPTNRKVKETFPLRNYVFFDESSTEIPNRYVKLNAEEALQFKEAQFQEPEPKNVAGRSERQLTVYYNILNILGDRMRKDPATMVTLIGSSAGKGAEVGKAEAEAVKKYLVTIFAIGEARITTEGRDQPIAPSEQPGGKKQLDLLRAGDRRVDIVSSSAILLVPLQILAVQVTPLDDRIAFKTTGGDKEPLASWSLELMDSKGTVQRFGPFTKEQEYISGNVFLGNHSEENYKIVMLAKTTDGKTIRKESTLHLVRNPDTKEAALRFSVLFDFNQSETVKTYEKFLTDVITPLIPEMSKVIIHGHSDVIGDEDHNMILSQERAQEVQRILERALVTAGKKKVTFETYGFGADPDMAPFENNLPEERFYNRTVIIDIVPAGN
jgi:outer membrane protein OmpA-like peptidoglycan-associated protein